MPSTENKATTPFKTMDIKSALLAGSRKRKASSPQVCKTEVKKLSLDNENNDDEIQILDGGCGITITLDQSALNTSLGDCKENKDINSSEAVTGANNVDCKKNKELNNLSEDITNNVNKTALTPKVAIPISPKPTQNESDKEMEQLLSDKCKNSDHSSCDDLSTSAINSSINISLNSDGITAEEKEMETESKNKKTENNATGENTQKNEASNKQKKKKKMTPAESKKRAEEREQKLKERLLKKEELENKKKERLLEKERRQKEKILKKEREELERKERERIKQEKKEQEEKEKMMKQKEKDEKLQKKLEEQKKKEELKQKKDEELKKAEEEKLKKLEKEQKEKEKAERAKAAFAKFFVRGDTSTSTPVAQVPEKEGAFLPFQVSDDMILAPVVQPAAQKRFDRKQLDHYLEYQDGKELYLQILTAGSYKDVRQRKRTQKLPTSEADVIIIDNNAQAELCLMAKLLQFNENVRPPYFGTWRKKSKNVRPRNPWGQDEIFDYTVDSDDEWDEGGPGESLSGTEEEDQAEEGEDDYDIDNQFMVPHGYLSDEEGKMEDDDEEVNDPEKQKALLKIKLLEFENERKKKTTELKPIILGCYFCNDPAFQDAGLRAVLQIYTAEVLTETPVPTRFTYKKPQSATNTSESPKFNNTKKRKGCLVPEEAMPQLIRFIHGNIRNRKVLAEDFQKLWTEQSSGSPRVKQDLAQTSDMEVDEVKNTTTTEPTSDSYVSPNQFYKTIKEIATYCKPPEPSINKCCWWVHESIREKYGLVGAPFPSDKSYVTSVPLKVDDKQLSTVKGVSIKEFLSPN